MIHTTTWATPQNITQNVKVEAQKCMYFSPPSIWNCKKGKILEIEIRLVALLAPCRGCWLERGMKELRGWWKYSVSCLGVYRQEQLHEYMHLSKLQNCILKIGAFLCITYYTSIKKKFNIYFSWEIPSLGI